MCNMCNVCNMCNMLSVWPYKDNVCRTRNKKTKTETHFVRIVIGQTMTQTSWVPPPVLHIRKGSLCTSNGQTTSTAIKALMR